MDSRFVAVWHEMRAKRNKEPFDRTLAHAEPDTLVQALAGAGTEDPVAANAIATELLNRLRRARYFGAFLATAGIAIVLLVFDILVNGMFGLVEKDAVNVDLSLVALFIGLVALLALVAASRMWRKFSGDEHRP